MKLFDIQKELKKHATPENIEKIKTEVEGILNKDKNHEKEKTNHIKEKQQDTANTTEKDKFQKLRELGELKDSGILTEEEFEQEKKKILSE